MAPAASAVEALEALAGPLPDEPAEPRDVLDLLDRVGSPATVATNAGRYFGFVNGGALPASMAAAWLAAAWDQNAALRVMSPAAATLEDVALEWARDVLGLPAGCGGALTTGATMANLTGLAAARHALLERAGWDVERDGLFGAPPLTVVVGDEVHVSLLKALGLLGLGRQRVQRVAVDDQGRMRADSLPALDARHDRVRTGRQRELRRVRSRGGDLRSARTRRARGCTWTAPSGSGPRRRRAIATSQRRSATADSWATDGHKWPNVGYDCGLAFVRDAHTLRSTMAMSSAYFAPTGDREPSQFTPEMSRRARGIELWATLRSLGRAGLADLIDRTCVHAARFAEGLRALGCDVLNDVVINQVLVSFGSDADTRAVIAHVQQDGTCWCGGTEWHGRAAMRISVSSWATTADDVDRSLAAIDRAMTGVREAGGGRP